MGIFDKLKSTAEQAVNTAATSAASAIGSKRETFTFTALPESLAEMQALPEASMDTPFKTAALTVLALCAYAAEEYRHRDAEFSARSASSERTGDLLPERPLPRRKDLSALHLLLRLDA